MIVPPKGEFLPLHKSPVGLIDLAATLSAIGSGTSLGSGRDLRSPKLEPAPIPLEHFAYKGKGRNLGPRGHLRARAVVLDNWKLFEIEGRFELYDLEADPKEWSNRADAQPERVARMRAMLPPLEERSDRVVTDGKSLDAKTLESLRAIGYVE